MLVSVLLMATARHGIRVVSFEEPLALQAKATESYMNASLEEYKRYKENLKNAPQKDLSDPAVLADEKGCMGCHAIDEVLVGPSFKSVAAKYTKKEEFIASILQGSEGKWGEVPMPIQDVSEEQANKLGDWILSHK